MDHPASFQRKGLILGRRIYVMGNSCTGNSLLAAAMPATVGFLVEGGLTAVVGRDAASL